MSKPTDELTTEKAHENRRLHSNPERKARFALIAITIVTSAALGYLPILPMTVYATSLLGLAGVWIVGLLYLKGLKHPSAKLEKEIAEQTVLTEARPQSQPAVASGGLLHAMQQHPLASYFTIAYAMKWGLLVPYTLAAWGVISGDWTAAFILATFGPLVAGFIMAYATQGRRGVSRLRDSIWHWRVGGRWLLFAFAVIPALVMIGIIALPGALVGCLVPSPSLLL